MQSYKRKYIFKLNLLDFQEVIKINQEKYDEIIEEFACTMNKSCEMKNE